MAPNAALSEHYLIQNMISSKMQFPMQAAFRFIYLPLADGEFRMLTLQPGQYDEEIKCDLSQHTFEKYMLKYEALSYVWGTPENSGTIGVRIEQTGKCGVPDAQPYRQLVVTRNLELALRHLRRQHEPRVLWVDAICINQSDDKEKSTEVERMSSIYRKATRVVIWLGPSADNSSLAFQTMRWIVENDIIKRLRNDFQLQIQMKEAWIAIQNLFNRDWFTRLWVFQEHHLAQEAIFVVGSDKIRYSQFRTALGFIYDTIFDWSDSPMASSFEFETLRRREFFFRKPHKHVTLVNLLYRTKDLHCLDPRDRIYSNLSMCQTQQTAGLKPNYSCPPEVVYKDVTLRHIKDGSLNILELCEFDLLSAGPSWVLTGSFSGLPEILPHISDACGNSRHEYVSCADDSTLLIRGIFVDTIREVSILIPDDTSLSEVHSSCRFWQPHSTMQEPYVSGGTLHDAFALTLVAGNMQPEDCGSILTSLQTDMGDAHSSAGAYISMLQVTLPRRAFFTGVNGYMGLCVQSAMRGDMICVALGKNNPLVLRPVVGRACHYRLIGGSSYIYGLENGEALLGPTPKIQKEIPLEEIDARIGPLPFGWKCLYKDEDDLSNDGGLHDQRRNEDDLLLNRNDYDDYGRFEKLYYKNSLTGKIQLEDPRMTPEALKARGIDIKYIYVI